MQKLWLSLWIGLLALPAQAEENLDNELALAARWLDAQRAYDRVPGMSVAIVKDQDLLLTGATGYAELESRRPAAEDTIYGICSISKLFTGIAVMQLRDRGLVDLDDPVQKLLPWFELPQAFEDSSEITLEGLLTHSAGLPRESDSPYWTGPDFDFPSREEIRAGLSGQATIYPAARYFQYSNLGLSLAGEIVAEKSGLAFERYIDEQILQPLGFDDTATGFPEGAKADRVATGYSFPGRDGLLEALPLYDARGITPAAGFTSTAPDLARFAAWQFRLFAGKDAAEDAAVLQANTLREMQRVHWLDTDWGVAWGLAFHVSRQGERTLVGHGGSCPGFNTRLAMDPVKRVGVVLMANRNGVDLGGYTARLFDILEAGGAAPEGGGKAAGPDLEPYIGSYDQSPWHGEEMVLRWKGGLATVNLPTMDPLKSLTRLEHLEGDRFRTIRSDDSPGHEVRFRRDESGRVTHMISHSNEMPRM